MNAALLEQLNDLGRLGLGVPLLLITLLAMLCFQRGQNAAGGALLAYATLSKLFPGLHNYAS